MSNQTVSRKEYTRFINNNKENISKYAFDMMVRFLDSDEPYSLLEYYLFDAEEKGHMSEYEVTICHQPLAEWRERVKSIIGPSKYVGVTFFQGE